MELRFDNVTLDQMSVRIRRVSATCPPHFKTIDRVDHSSWRPNFGISREFPNDFANRGVRDSSDHCSTN